MNHKYSLCFFVIAFSFLLNAAGKIQPTHLMTDLLEHTDKVFLNGYPTELSLQELNNVVEPHQFAAIRQEHPSLGWEIESDEQAVKQTAYRILVATDLSMLNEGQADVWDSQKNISDQSTSVQCEGKALQPSTTYFWKVKIWDNHGNESSYSAPKCFRTANALDHTYPEYPLQKSDEYPVQISKTPKGNQLFDFGKDAFGTITLTLTSVSGNDTIDINLGEKVSNNEIDRNPGGSIRYTRYTLPLSQGTHTYHLKIRPDSRNTNPKANESGVKPIFMPDYIGEVFPFRYCEIENYATPLSQTDIHRTAVHYPFNDNAASFSCSDEILNQVWELCKYSIKATSFSGVYVDGDRERIPYEADAYINQLGHYCTDKEFSMARYSIDYLMQYPTWPTEWIMQAVLMVWNEYMYTGNKDLLTKHYDKLKARTLLQLKQENSLISTKIEKQSQDFLNSIGYRGKAIRDIVDWPQSGALGIDKKEAGEADGYDLREYNTVVNAYHCEALHIMAKIADALGKDDEFKDISIKATNAENALNKLMFDKNTGYYKDGISSTHHSLHANMFPLAFNLVPSKLKKRIVDFLHTRGMACSVYGSQFLLDALYNADDADYALTLLNSKNSRSWYNMLQVGSTITLEAWDAKFKPNLDWNHAWGAAPANIIPRKLMGVEPLLPGFQKIRIKPQPSNLTWAKAVIPTIKGSVRISFKQETEKTFILNVSIPANTDAEVWCPRIDKKGIMYINGKEIKGRISDKYIILNIPSGNYEIEQIAP